MTALGNFFRERAAAYRSTARERTDDLYYTRSADALEDLADYADDVAPEGLFQVRYLLEHHVAGGAFAWPDGQSGRAVSRWGFDQPVGVDPIEREQS